MHSQLIQEKRKKLKLSYRQFDPRNDGDNKKMEELSKKLNLLRTKLAHTAFKESIDFFEGNTSFFKEHRDRIVSFLDDGLEKIELFTQFNKTLLSGPDYIKDFELMKKWIVSNKKAIIQGKVKLLKFIVQKDFMDNPPLTLKDAEHANAVAKGMILVLEKYIDATQANITFYKTKHYHQGATNTLIPVDYNSEDVKKLMIDFVYLLKGLNSSENVQDSALANTKIPDTKLHQFIASCLTRLGLMTNKGTGITPGYVRLTWHYSRKKK